MVKKVAKSIDEPNVTLEFAALPVSVSETAALPVIEAKVEAPSDEADKDRPDEEVPDIMLKIAELEAKFVQLQTELNTLVNKKKNKKRGSKEKKVKCKCKDKKVEIDKCKCKSKETDK
jgi:hypothetical protein